VCLYTASCENFYPGSPDLHCKVDVPFSSSFLLSSMLQLAILRVIKKPNCVIHNCTCVRGRVYPLKSCILKPHPQFFSCMFCLSIWISQVWPTQTSSIKLQSVICKQILLIKVVISHDQQTHHVAQIYITTSVHIGFAYLLQRYMQVHSEDYQFKLPQECSSFSRCHQS